MSSYRFLRDYNATVNGTRVYAEEGAEADLDDETAAAIEADAPGIFGDKPAQKAAKTQAAETPPVEPAKEAAANADESDKDTPKARSVDAPPSDRQVKAASSKRSN